MRQLCFYFAGNCETPVYKKKDGARACGIFLKKGLTWFSAVAKCTAKGARLPVITNAKENADILSLQVCN